MPLFFHVNILTKLIKYDIVIGRKDGCMDIQNVDINRVKGYYRNAKKHDTKQIKNVAESISQFGFVQPIVIDKDGIIIIGHCRYEAAKRLRMDKVPCVRAEDLTDEQVQKLRLLDNKLNESEWDMDLLLEDVPLLDWDGFDIDWGLELDDIDIGKKEVSEGDVPDDVETRCKLGDIWQLGDHRLICGDSTDVNVIDRLMQNDHAKILFTSPPYSDMREYNGDKDVSVAKICRFISACSNYADVQFVNLGIQVKNKEVFPYWDTYIEEAHRCNLKLLSWLVWDKQNVGSIGQQKMFIPIRHEWIFAFGKDTIDVNLTWDKKPESMRKKSKTKRRQADGSIEYSSVGDSSKKHKKMESVITILSEVGKIRSKHPAVFPIALPSEFVQAMTDEGDIVLEPFGGSGSTLIACEQLGRQCRIVELDEHYCNVILQRWEEFTGETAIRVKEGGV